MKIEELYVKSKPYLPLSLGPIAICFAIDFARFLLGFAQLVMVAFLFFEISMLLLGIYCGIMRSLSAHFKYDGSKLNICRATPVFNWGLTLGSWAIKEADDKVEETKS